MHFVLWTKVSHKSTNFDTLKVFRWKIAKFFKSFSQPQVGFFSFHVKRCTLCTKGTKKSENFLVFYVLGSKFTKFLLFLKQQISYSHILHHSLVSWDIYNSTVSFQLEFYILSTKEGYQNTNLVKFHLSSQKSEILYFGGLFLLKSNKVSAKKVQKSYLSWHRRMMQSLKKNWLVVSLSNLTWGIWWIFTQTLKCPKMLLPWDIFLQNIWDLS